MSKATKNMEEAGGLSAIDNWLVSRIKKQSNKTDPGTSHPADGSENQSKDVVTGERHSELSDDVKSQVIAQSSDESKESEVSGEGRGENTYTLSDASGVSAEPGGEDPENETPGTKKTPDDPGTKHPAKTASVIELGDKILADISVAASTQSIKDASEHEESDESEDESETETEEKKEASKKDNCDSKSDNKNSKKKASAKDSESDSDDSDDEMMKQAGYEVAKSLATALGLVKEASDEGSDASEEEVRAYETLKNVKLAAISDASKVVDYLKGFAKQAAIMDPAMAQEGEIPPEVLMELAQAEAEAEAAGEVGGEELPPEAMAMEEGAEPAMEGGVSEDEILDQLAEALMEENVSPEELEMLTGAKQASLKKEAKEQIKEGLKSLVRTKSKK